MPPVSIENPLNSPFVEPARHFKFDDVRVTSEIAEGRRRSMSFLPTGKAKAKGVADLTLPGDWVSERMTDLPKQLEHLLQVIASSEFPPEESACLTL